MTAFGTMNVSRRNLLKGAALAAGLAALGVPSFAMAAEPAAVEPAKVALHRAYAAPHGTKSFAQVVVALDEAGTIVAANVDEYQFMAADTEGLVPVPNADAEFAEGFAEGVVLVSKKDNNEVYSAHMAEKAGSTQPWATSIAAIEAFAAGKKPEELAGVDAVSGATLADTAGYVAAIAAAAASTDIVSEGEGGLDGAILGRANAAAHGTKAFANAVTLVSGDTIVATSIDEFQFMAADTEGLVPVPNADAEFAEGFAEGVMLASKSMNNASYSAHMAEKAGATTEWLVSMQAIEASLVGTKLDGTPLEVDAVSGATLVDTAGYVQNALDAALEA